MQVVEVVDARSWAPTQVSDTRAGNCQHLTVAERRLPFLRETTASRTSAGVAQ